ncbi:TPA: hypothetical protein BOS_4187 [Bos taurus]|nr:TPA: hypothetical protein BOS_4187 [Bos taurus]
MTLKAVAPQQRRAVVVVAAAAAAATAEREAGWVRLAAYERRRERERRGAEARSGEAGRKGYEPSSDLSSASRRPNAALGCCATTGHALVARALRARLGRGETLSCPEETTSCYTEGEEGSEGDQSDRTGAETQLAGPPPGFFTFSKFAAVRLHKVRKENCKIV